MGSPSIKWGTSPLPSSPFQSPLLLSASEKEGLWVTLCAACDTGLCEVKAKSGVEMEFLVPKKGTSSSPAPSADAHQQRHPAEASGRGPVTSSLQLRASPGEHDDDRGRRPLDKDVVLRRIRHHRQATQIRDAAQTTSLRLAGGERWCGGWMDEDAFSSP